MTQLEFTDQIKMDIAALRKQVEQSFYFLEAEELNAKPSKTSWSILQCIEHINLTNHLYLKAFRRRIEGATDFTHADDKAKLSSLGKIMIKAMKPKEGKIRWKMKTFSFLKPLNERDESARLLERVVFEKFNEDMDELESMLDDIAKLPWRKTKIKSALGKALKLRLGDAAAFLIAHSERHILQAQKVKERMVG